MEHNGPLLAQISLDEVARIEVGLAQRTLRVRLLP
jgi:hypothetical protein